MDEDDSTGDNINRQLNNIDFNDPLHLRGETLITKIDALPNDEKIPALAANFALNTLRASFAAYRWVDSEHEALIANISKPDQNFAKEQRNKTVTFMRDKKSLRSFFAQHNIHKDSLSLDTITTPDGTFTSPDELGFQAIARSVLESLAVNVNNSHGLETRGLSEKEIKDRSDDPSGLHYLNAKLLPASRQAYINALAHEPATPSEYGRYNSDMSYPARLLAAKIYADLVSDYMTREG